MASKKEKEHEVVVVTGGLSFPAGEKREIGDTVKMTEGQIRSRVGKVVLKSEYNKAPGSGDSSEESKALKKQVAELEKQVQALTADLEAATKAE
jgi:hypothetical protein